MNAIELSQVYKSYDRKIVLNGVSLSIEQGMRVVLSGPSACGKTTLLRIIAGLEVGEAGTVVLMGRRVAEGRRTLVEPEARGIGMVFQDLALWPHMSVAQHLDFAIRYANSPPADPKERARRMLELVQLQGCAHAKPHALSGGQQQRLALARALAGEPRIVLMDEPLSSLDEELRIHLRTEILRLHALLAFTLLYVTHDREEARIIGSRVITMSHGSIADA